MLNNHQNLKLLLIEDNLGDVGLVKSLLKDVESGIILQSVTKLMDAKKILNQDKFDIILLDLNLPDSMGIDTFLKIKPLADSIPVIIFTVITDKDISIEAMKQGAQDFLVKNTINSEVLIRSLFYAIERKKLSEKLQKSETQFREILEKDPYAILIVKEDKIIFANSAFKNLLNVREQLTDKPLHIFFSGDILKKIIEHTGRFCNNHKVSKFEWQIAVGSNKKIDAFLTISPIQISSELHHQIIIQDLSELKLTDDYIKNLAFRDPLTGVNNRNQLEEKITMMIENASKTNCFAAIAFMDVDNFKTINDCYGHMVGDQFLKVVAERLKHNIRPTDIIVRMGGDEFVIIFGGIETKDQIELIIKKVFDNLKQPCVINKEKIATTFSMGVSVFPVNGEKSATLLSLADNALYDVKKAGKNAYKICI